MILWRDQMQLQGWYSEGHESLATRVCEERFYGFNDNAADHRWDVVPWNPRRHPVRHGGGHGPWFFQSRPPWIPPMTEPILWYAEAERR